jgi:hypothetical protein
MPFIQRNAIVPTDNVVNVEIVCEQDAHCYRRGAGGPSRARLTVRRLFMVRVPTLGQVTTAGKQCFDKQS